MTNSGGLDVHADGDDIIVPAGTMTGGVANFTYPGTTGASCTVTYSVCAPAPNTTICDTAVLTVTAGAAPALTKTKSDAGGAGGGRHGARCTRSRSARGEWADDGGDQRQ